LVAKQYALWNDEIVPLLAQQKIYVHEVAA